MMSFIQKASGVFIAAVIMSAASSAFAGVLPSDPPVDYSGPQTFNSDINKNVRLMSGTATIDSGALLEGYFWGTGGSSTEWKGGSVASYLQADGGASIEVIGHDLVLSDLGAYATGEHFNISGFLSSGESVNIDAYTYSRGTIGIENVPVDDGGGSVPEPATMGLLGMGLVGLLAQGLAKNHHRR